jgi:hypothetical protein
MRHGHEVVWWIGLLLAFGPMLTIASLLLVMAAMACWRQPALLWAIVPFLTMPTGVALMLWAERRNQP